MFRKLLNNAVTQRQEDRQADLYKNLIRHEAQIGGELFGPVPEGGRREFFCLDRHTWIWHEEWVDKTGQKRIKTTRYDIRPDGILKAQDGQHYQQLNLREARNLQQAIHNYNRRVKNELYNFV